MGTIEWPDGTMTRIERKDEPMSTGDSVANTQLSSARAGLGQQDPPRTIATVAAELEAALVASTRVKALRDELETLLGRKKRAKKEK